MSFETEQMAPHTFDTTLNMLDATLNAFWMTLNTFETMLAQEESTAKSLQATLTLVDSMRQHDQPTQLLENSPLMVDQTMPKRTALSPK